LRKRAAQEMEDELGSYVDSAVEDRVRHGMPEAEAQRAVHVQVGSKDAIKERMGTTG